MHIHRIQNDLALELNALYAARKAEAKQRAEETRRKLSEFASLLEEEAEEVVFASSGSRGGSEHEAGRRYQNEDEQSDPESEEAEPQISDWA